MSSLRHRAPLLLAFALLFPLSASAPLACCAGVAAGAHATPSGGGARHCGGGDDDGGSGDCCARAAEDAASRHCCEGGDRFEGPQAGGQPILSAAAMLGTATPATGAQLGPSSSLRDPVPRLEPLYTLHSSLLI